MANIAYIWLKSVTEQCTDQCKSRWQSSKTFKIQSAEQKLTVCTQTLQIYEVLLNHKVYLCNSHPANGMFNRKRYQWEVTSSSSVTAAWATISGKTHYNSTQHYISAILDSLQWLLNHSIKHTQMSKCQQKSLKITKQIGKRSRYGDQ